jgi:hypothetical protein
MPDANFKILATPSQQNWNVAQLKIIAAEHLEFQVTDKPCYTMLYGLRSSAGCGNSAIMPSDSYA